MRAVAQCNGWSGLPSMPPGLADGLELRDTPFKRKRNATPFKISPDYTQPII